ncbi:MAG: hypothetical protein ACQGVC_20530 [Myxococcota bacterium]
MSTRSLAYWIALLGGAELAVRGHLVDDPLRFHAGAWLLAAVLLGTAWRKGLRTALGSSLAALAAVPVGLSLLAWAGVPPREHNALAGFWEAHPVERRTLSTPVRRGPVRIFDHEIPVDARGLRTDAGQPGVLGDEVFSIVALGGSTTFGATRTPEELPWPALLQERIDTLSCRRRVVVTNGGRLGRALGGSAKDFSMDFRRHAPDLVVFYPAPQDVAGLMGEIDADVTPDLAVPPRASAFVRRIEDELRSVAVARRFRDEVASEPGALDLEAISLTPTYRRFLLELRRAGVDVALASASLAVNERSSERSIRRHEAIDPRTRRMLLANRLHGRFIRALGARYRALVIDTHPGLDGRDEASFIDLFHLNQAGRERLAENVFQGLLHLLERPEPGCTIPPAASDDV